MLPRGGIRGEGLACSLAVFVESGGSHERDTASGLLDGVLRQDHSASPCLDRRPSSIACRAPPRRRDQAPRPASATCRFPKGDQACAQVTTTPPVVRRWLGSAAGGSCARPSPPPPSSAPPVRSLRRRSPERALPAPRATAGTGCHATRSASSCSPCATSWPSTSRAPSPPWPRSATPGSSTPGSSAAPWRSSRRCWTPTASCPPPATSRSPSPSTQPPGPPRWPTPRPWGRGTSSIRSSGSTSAPARWFGRRPHGGRSRGT